MPAGNLVPCDRRAVYNRGSERKFLSVKEIMRGSYAYSFDRDSFEGEYSTREQAYKAAVARADQLNIAADTPIYTGQRMAANPQADAHARQLVNAMRRRARETVGGDAVDYLKSVTEDQMIDLDRAIEAVVTRWLSNYKLAPQWYRIGAVSEHPMPLVHQVRSSNEREIFAGVGN